MFSLKQKLLRYLDPQKGDYLHGELMCDVRKCTSLYGFGFADDDWHYLAGTMRQLLVNPQLSLHETWLWRYFEHFKPKNMWESLYDKAECLDRFQVLTSFRDAERGPMPWTPSYDLTQVKFTAPFLGDHGPWPEELIADRLKRIRGVLKAIRVNGYRHDNLANADDCIRGVMIKYGNDWRMVIIGGNHRASALAALGHKFIPVQAHRSFPAIIDIETADNWPVVRLGHLSKGVAQDIAKRYFTDRGVSKAQSWGIL
jgi:hypothetical protein